MGDTLVVNSMENHASRVTTTAGPSAQEWESHRGTITRLYLEEDLPLPEVSVIMEHQYKFKATCVLLVSPS